jgi:hypothetical protein
MRYAIFTKETKDYPQAQTDSLVAAWQARCRFVGAGYKCVQIIDGIDGSNAGRRAKDAVQRRGPEEMPRA